MSGDATPSALPALPVLRAAVWAVRTLFFVSGFVFATWGVHIPTVKAVYAISEATLGLALLAAGFGAIGGMSQAGRLLTRFGARLVARICGCLYALLLGVLLFMPGLIALFALLTVFGLLTSVFDVAINAEGSELERRCARPLFSGMHGMFSAGGMAGAASGGAWLAAGGSAPLHLACVAAAGALVILLAAARMPRHAALPAVAAAPGSALPRGRLAVLGILAALGFLAEGAIYDWSVLYMYAEIGSPQAQAAWAYASFSAAMALTRFGGDALRARFPGPVLLRGSALLAALGMAGVLLAREPWVALAGFALVGIGLANVVPLLFSAAARVPGISPAHGIAAVSACAYVGMMGGPPAIGLLAEVSSLTAALWLVVLCAAVLALWARRVGP